METLADCFRWFRSLFGVQYVTLIDWDGDRHVRAVRWAGGHPWAMRMGLSIDHRVLLLSGGNVRRLDGHETYVHGWERYTPFQRVSLAELEKQDDHHR